MAVTKANRINCISLGISACQLPAISETSCRRRRSQGRSSENLFLSTERKPALINKMGRRKIVIKQIEDEKLRRVSENISYIYMKRTVIDICL